MVKYSCIRCGYETEQKSNFKTHLNRKNLCKSKLNDVDIIQVYTDNKIDIPDEITPNSTKNHQNNTKIPPKNTKIPPKNTKIILNNENLQCKYCKKIFSRIDAKNRHEKSRCKNINELILYKKQNSEIELLKKEVIEIKNENSKIKNENSKIKNKLKNTKITNNNNTNNTNNIGTQNNITLVNYGDENLELITQRIVERIIDKKPYTAIQELILYKHFNKKHPENMNVRIRNLNNKYGHIYKDGKWIIEAKKRLLDDLIDDSWLNITNYEISREFNAQYTNRCLDIREQVELEKRKYELINDTNRIIYNQSQELEEK